jgi:hypothetical protein
MATPASVGGPTKVYQYKLVLLGDSAVGKSSLVLRFAKGQFFEFQESTIGGTSSFSLVLLLICLIQSDSIVSQFQLHFSRKALSSTMVCTCRCLFQFSFFN